MKSIDCISPNKKGFPTWFKHCLNAMVSGCVMLVLLVSAIGIEWLVVSDNVLSAIYNSLNSLFSEELLFGAAGIFITTLSIILVVILVILSCIYSLLNGLSESEV